MGEKEKDDMSITYLFGKEEIKCLIKLLRSKDDSFWSEREEKVLSVLERRGYLFAKKGVIYLEPVLKLFLNILHEPEEKLQLDEGRLYQKQGIFLWVCQDERKLDGIALRPYKTMEEWYDGEKEHLEYSVEYYVGEMTKHGQNID